MNPLGAATARRAALAILVALGLHSGTANAAPLDVQIGATDPAQREGWKALVADFRAANPDVEVHLTLTDVPSHRKALPASLEGDTAPDVFNWFAGDGMRSLALRGRLDDLSDLWKANNWWNTFPAASATVAGRQVALPYDTYPWGLFVRHDVLERAGVKEAPRDLSALMTACSKLRKAGFTPVALGGRDGSAVAAWFDFIDMRANGYEFHQQLLEGKISYNDANVRRAFLMWKQLMDAKCFDTNAMAVDRRGAEALLYAGKAGMLLSGTVASAGFPDIVRPVIDYARFPTIDSSLPAAEPAPTDTLHIAARAHNKADARRFLKFAASSSAQAKLAKAQGSFPSNKNAAAAGTVLDLSAYKVLTDAKANVVQGYDRDVPATMAQEGVKGFQDFLAQPAQMYPILDRLDRIRAIAYAPPAVTADAAPAARPPKK
jgi:multiple sugar transport system substrate-binding protein